MYGYLKGKLLTVNQDRIILDTGGVGYEVLVGQKWLAKYAAQTGSEFGLYLHTAVRDKDITLIGFEVFADKLMFERLLKVSSVGPKTALLVISEKSSAAIERAVDAQDIEFFLGIKGLAKKTAQKIIIELRSQFKALAREQDRRQAESAAELAAALRAVGFSPREITSVTGKIDTTQPLENQVREALTKLHT